MISIIQIEFIDCSDLFFLHWNNLYLYMVRLKVSESV